MRHLLAVCTLFFLFSISGCGSEDGFTPQPAPSGQLRVVNAIPDSPGFSINFENQGVGFVDFGDSTPFVAVLPEVTRSLRVLYISNSQQTTLVQTELRIGINRFATAVITGTMANPQILLLDEAPVEFETGKAGVRFVHAASSVSGSVDFHLTTGDDPPGVAITTVPANSISEFFLFDAAEDLHLRAIASADSSTLWDSGVFATSAATGSLFVLLDYFGPGGGSARMIAVSSAGSLGFPSEVLPAAVHFLNMIPDRTAIDFYLDDVLIAEDLLFGDITDFTVLTAGDHTVRSTTANDATDVIVENTFTGGAGTFNSLAATGIGTTNSHLAGTEDRRRALGSATVSIKNFSPEAGLIDAFLLSSGQTVTNIRPTVDNLVSPGARRLKVLPGTYDVVLTEAANSTIVFGPSSTTFEDSHLYQLYFTDVDGGGGPVQLILREDPPVQ